MFLDWMNGSENAELRARGAAKAEARQRAVTVEVVRSQVMAEFTTAVLGFEKRLPAVHRGNSTDGRSPVAAGPDTGPCSSPTSLPIPTSTAH